MKDMCLRTEIVWVYFTIKVYQIPDSACAPLFVTMVASLNIFKVVFPKVPNERPEMLRLSWFLRRKSEGLGNQARHRGK
jgi:hypothetical protein